MKAESGDWRDEVFRAGLCEKCREPRLLFKRIDGKWLCTECGETPAK